MERMPVKFPTARQAGTDFPLRVYVGSVAISGATVPEYFTNILRHVDDQELLGELPLPLQTSGENYLIATSPRHSSGKPFAHFIVYNGAAGEKLYINTNHPRFFALRQGARILEALGIKVFLTPEESQGMP
jgi:hypothetical protein